jgi:hypothetical protein
MVAKSDLPMNGTAMLKLIMQRTAYLMSANWLAMLAVTLLPTVPSVLLDLRFFEADASYGINFVLVFGNLFAVYWFTRHVLLGAIASTSAPPRSRFGGYILVGIATQIPFALGLLLLVVPGLFLLARWYIATAILLAEDTSVDVAMGASRDRTSGFALPIIGSWTVLILPVIVASVILFSAGDAPPTLVASVLANILLYLGGLTATVGGIAVYLILKPVPETQFSPE